MYRGILLLSVFAFLLGSHEANAAAASRAAAQKYTTDAVAAVAILYEARYSLRDVAIALTKPENADINQLKKDVQAAQANIKAQFLSLEPSVEKLLRDDEKEFYKKTQEIRNEYENSWSLALDTLIRVVEAKLSKNAKVREEAEKLAEPVTKDFESLQTKITETIEKLTALHTELEKLPRDVAEVTCASNSNQVRSYRLQHDALISAEVLFVLSTTTYLAIANKNSNRHQEIKSLVQNVEIGMAERISSTTAAIAPTILLQSREVNLCKPNNHELDTTYTELDPFFSSYLTSKYAIEHLVNFTLTDDEDTFWHSDKCLGFQKDRKCSGKLLECSPTSLRNTYVCPADKNKSYRYEYLRFDNGVTMPKKAKNKKCDTDEVFLENNTGSVNIYCHYTHCKCEDGADDIVRHFSLKNATSDVQDNKVVTGVRLRKENYAIHLQVQQGRILKNGAIDQGSVNWKNIDTQSPLDPKAEEYRDFVTIRADQRTICLERIDASQRKETVSNHVLTGVRFGTKRTDANELYIELQIQLTPYDGVTGRLNPKRSVWFGSEETKKHELNGYKFIGSLTDVGRTFQECVSFTPSLFQDVDLGQSVLPRISLQDLTVSPAVPLTGVGLNLDRTKIPDKPVGGTIQVDSLFTYAVSNYYIKQSIRI